MVDGVNMLAGNLLAGGNCDQICRSREVMIAERLMPNHAQSLAPNGVEEMVNAVATLCHCMSLLSCRAYLGFLSFYMAENLREFALVRLKASAGTRACF